MAIKPILQALLLAERVYFDGESGKGVIAGTFDSLSPSVFPNEFRQVSYAYLSLTEVHGKVDLLLRYVDLKTNEILMQYGPVQVSANDPLSSVELRIGIPFLPMPHEGVFALEVYAADELIGSHRVTVFLAEKEENSDEHD